jgi:ubiquinol-cytochrome c reductase iron-sulfur subunit
MSEHPPDGAPADASRTLVPMPVARLNEPQLSDMARNPQRTESLIGLVLLVGIVGVAGFGAAYWVNAKPVYLAVTMGVGLFALGFGLTAWGKYLMPRGPFVEERHVLASSEESREAMAAAIVERGGLVVKRRRMLGGLFALGAGIFSIVALFPLLRSLGPVPGDTFEYTNWRKNSRIVYSDGRPVHWRDIEPGGITTVFPEGYENDDQSQSIDQTVLIRLAELTPGENLIPPTMPGRETWSPAGYVAYSKMCTHLGCPVGLYEQQLELLVCPCHQSMFNVPGGCLPIFGPAPRPLPQLPLKIDAAGYLRAQAPYDQPVGPGYWTRA